MRYSYAAVLQLCSLKWHARMYNGTASRPWLGTQQQAAHPSTTLSLTVIKSLPSELFHICIYASVFVCGRVGEEPPPCTCCHFICILLSSPAHRQMGCCTVLRALFPLHKVPKKCFGWLNLISCPNVCSYYVCKSMM